MSDHLTLGPRVVNSIAWGNADGFGDELSQVNWYENYSLPRVKYSCIQDLETNLGTNNDDDDPVFLDSPACNYRLAANSLSRNAGLNTEVPADDQDLDIDNDVTEKTPDLDMHDRVIETTVGRGAYEVQLAPDCDQDSIPDATEIANCPTNDPSCHDCNGNGVPDGCDIASGFSQDANDNDVPDECDPDCNGNGVPDDLDIAQSTSTDINQSGIPDECESIVIGQWTSEVDFNRGTRINVSWDGDVGGLKRNPIATTTPLPYIWVALTEKGSVVRIRTEDEPAPGTGKTGDILGEYWTTPGNTGSNHSRTTVDLDGNAYVANRYDSWDPQGPSGPMGSVAKFGLVIGGERVDRNGSPDPNGEYLKPPFDYCTCQDRDADGLLRTSRGLGDRLAWTDYFNNDIDGGVETAEDECILAFERTRDVGIRTLGIDPSNNV